jgi:hypothetical protein
MPAVKLTGPTTAANSKKINTPIKQPVKIVRLLDTVYDSYPRSTGTGPKPGDPVDA